MSRADVDPAPAAAAAEPGRTAAPRRFAARARRPPAAAAFAAATCRLASAARRGVPAALALAVLAIAAGCGGPDRPRKPAGSALWTGAEEVAALPPGTLERLREAGVRELFVPAGRLAWSAEGPALEVTLGAPLPRRAPVTLVVQGDGPPPEPGEGLGRELARLRLAAEGRGLLALGIHLDLAAPSAAALGALAAALDGARGALGEGVFLSARLDPEYLGAEEAEALTRAADFVVCPLYGQPPEEPESEARWRLQRVDERVRRLEELGGDYLVGVTTVGAAYRLGRDGRRLDATGAADLTELVRNRALERTRDRLLAGWDRRELTFSARQRTRAAGWDLAAGEAVRAVQLQGRDLVELRRRLRDAELEHCLGELYVRAPRPEEGLALTLGDLADALLGVPPKIELTIELRDARRTADGLAFRVALINAGESATDAADVGTNYVELRVPGGSIASVANGDFRRYAMLIGGREATDMRAFRHADTVRLFATMIDAGEELVSGPVVVRTGGAGRIEAGGRFLLPRGGEYELAEQRWP